MSMLTPEAALAQVLLSCAPLSAETVDLSAALSRVLATAVVAGRTLPPWDNSAMDGYAVRAADVVPGRPLPVAGTLGAGRPAMGRLLPGQVLRIMTGAPLPEGADAVVMREEAEETEDTAEGKAPTVRFRLSPRPGDHVRRAGEDLAENDLALPQGALLHAGEIGLLAALGRTLVEVHRRPLVAIVSTGDELVPPDRPLLPGQIVGSNAHALAALVSEAGGVPRVLPIAPDHREALRATFAEALRADVVVSSGGVSVGEFDFVKQTLLDLGVEERFWRVAMKPGKPLSFGVRPASASAHQVPVFGLPGNPASAMVSFLYFVRPALRRLLGLSAEQAPLPRARVRLSGILRPDEKRLHITRARVERDQSGALVATPGGQQGSGMLRSMVGVNALLEIQPGPVPLAAGAEVIARLLSVV